MNATKPRKFSDAMPRYLNSAANTEAYIKSTSIRPRFRYKILETQADFQRSNGLGRLLTLEELPEFLSSGGLRALENTTLW